MSKRAKLFLEVAYDSNGVADVMLIKQTRNYNPRDEKTKDFRNHGEKRACKRYMHYDGNMHHSRTPKCCENVDYTSVYQSRFSEQRRMHDAYGKYPINATPEELIADMKEYNHICALREVIALGDQAITEIQNFWAWN